MDLKEISLSYKFGFPLSLSNLSSQSWPRNYKKKTKEINSREKKLERKQERKKIRKRVSNGDVLLGGCCCSFVTASRLT